MKELKIQNSGLSGQELETRRESNSREHPHVQSTLHMTITRWNY
jgi:hypothetical protein